MKQAIRQAITTRYIGPTNFRGSRIKAKAAAGSVMVNYLCDLNIEDNHTRAAKALAEKFGWGGRWFGGGLPDDRGYVFVCTDIDDDGAFFTEQRG